MTQIEIEKARGPILREVIKQWKYYLRDQGPSKLDNYILDTESEKILYNTIVALIENGDTEVLVATEESKVVGFIVVTVNTFQNLYQTRKLIGEISAIYVRRDYRGKGIGSKLLEEAMKYLQSKGVEIVLAEVRADNKASMKLFTKYGFTVDHTIHVLLKEL